MAPIAAKALVVDDEPDLLTLVTMTLAQMEITTIGVSTLRDARTALQEHTIDFCLTDMQLPDGEGIDLVREMQQNFPDVPIAVITAYGNMNKAVESLKAGAFDYVAKPLDIQILRKMVAQVTALRQDLAQPARHQHQLDDLLIGDCEPMQKLKRNISKVAKSQAPVFIWGESGTGKEVTARAIHRLSARHDGPFVAVNCGAIPSELIESELFGHRKGSFSGAIKDKIGLFKAADGGTLMLDEVADLPLHMQVKLLRVIQEKHIRPIGATAEEAIDCRIISATHKQLDAEISAQRFREDLYYRINVIALQIPPLRERGNDVLQLADQFLNQIAIESQSNKLKLSDASRKLLQTHPFVGNVRELQNALQRAAALCENGIIDSKLLQLQTPRPLAPLTASFQAVPPAPDVAPSTPSNYSPAKCGPLESYLKQVEIDAIQAALEKTHWNRTAAAKLLGMSFRSLRYKLKKLGLDE